MERKRGCDFLRMWTRVMEQQLYQFTEGYNILNDNRQVRCMFFFWGVSPLTFFFRSFGRILRLLVTSFLEMMRRSWRQFRP